MAIWPEEGAVAKITGKEGEKFTGPAKVFDNEYDAIEGIGRTVKKGDVIVIRYEGPKGAPGMPEMLKPTGAVIGAGLGKRCCPDHRWSIFWWISWFCSRSYHA